MNPDKPSKKFWVRRTTNGTKHCTISEYDETEPSNLTHGKHSDVEISQELVIDDTGVSNKFNVNSGISQQSPFHIVPYHRFVGALERKKNSYIVGGP